ncbi:uncharacterized protein LOC144208865 [Stigmatopora nigra]
MTDGDRRAHFQYADSQERQEEVLEEVRLAILKSYQSDVESGSLCDEEYMERTDSCSRGRKRNDEQGKVEVQQQEEVQEAELEVDVGPTLEVRIVAPIRDPDCISEEEEEQPYPALAPTAFFCMKQTTRPRNWCLRVVCNPYPFITWKHKLDYQLVRPTLSSFTSR